VFTMSKMFASYSVDDINAVSGPSDCLVRRSRRQLPICVSAGLRKEFVRPSTRRARDPGTQKAALSSPRRCSGDQQHRREGGLCFSAAARAMLTLAA
jgi:hypothetical protein